MKRIDSVAHIGITVEDLDRAVKFYGEALGFTYLRGAHFQTPFFEKNRALYQLPPETTECRTAVLEAPGHGLQLELFHFSQQLEPQRTPWNRAGITHFAVETDDVPAIAAQLKAAGAEFCIDIGVRPDGGKWLFVRDPDGNLVEIMEPFRF